MVASDSDRQKKTLEIRKNRPKLEPPFTVYIYQTLPKYGDWNEQDGRVVVEFVCDEIRHYPMPQSRENHAALRDFYWRAFLNTTVICEYSGAWTHDLYGWHISTLTVYDKPLPLLDFRNLRGEPVKRAPQSWCYVGKLVT